MTKLFSFILLALFACALPAQAQRVKTYRCFAEQTVKNGELWVDIYIHKLAGRDIPLGSGSLSFNVTGANFNLSAIRYDTTGLGPWSDVQNGSEYMSPTLKRSNNRLSFNIYHITAATTTGQNITINKQRVARIILPITNPAGFNTFTWNLKAAEIERFKGNSILAEGLFEDPLPRFPLCEGPNTPGLTTQSKTLICPGQSVDLQANATQAQEFEWLLNGTVVTTTTTPTLTVSNAGDYTVRAKNFNCYSASSTSLVVTAQPVTPKPLVTATLTDISVTNQTPNLMVKWFWNGLEITGVNSKQYYPTQNGDYTAAFEGPCGLVYSDPITFTIQSSTGVDPLTGTETFRVYPNPFRSSTRVTYVLSESKDVRLDVYNTVGQLLTNLVNEVQKPGTHQVDFVPTRSGLASGTYMLKLTIGNDTRTLRVVETNQ
jgi:hypothetical protein